MAVTMTSPSKLRRDQTSAVRERILAAATQVIEAGEQPSMRAVAQAAAIAERTLYRYFASLEQLHAALMPVLRERASAPMAESVDGLADYVRRLFATFDQNQRLARALLTAPWAPRSVTRPANMQALQKIINAEFPRAPRGDRESAVASLRVLCSAASWAYLADCGFELAASVRHVQWNVKTVIHRLRNPSGGSHA